MDVVPGTDTGQQPTSESQQQAGSSPVMTTGADPPQQPQLPDDLQRPTPPEGVGEEEEDASNSSASDVETFNGKIVYNADGSAYIIEGVDSELSDDEYSGLDLPLPVKSSSTTSTTTPRPTPQVVNALHIARHPAFYSALYGQAYTFLRENHKVPEIPVMHSYRVFTVRDSGDKADEHRNSSASSKATEGTTDTPPYTLWDCGTVPVKPILMCFICKLSFGYTKSFVAHATGEHSLSLNDAERELVSRKNTSAVIQGVSSEPLLSFLEPIPTSTTSSTQVSSSSSAGSGGFVTNSSVSSSSLIVHPATTASQHENIISSTASSSSSSCSTSFSSAITTVVSASSCPVTSVPDLAVTHKNEAATVPHLSSSNFNDVVMAPELEDLANIEKMAEAAAAAAAAAVSDSNNKSTPSPPSTNGPPDEITALNLQQERRIANNPSAVAMLSEHQQNLLMNSADRPVSRDSTGSVSPKGIVPHISTCHSPSAMAAVGINNTSSLGMCTHHPEGKASGVECPKCDMVLGSSRSLGGHMTMMHSRNSCKTLKCPKCNWHYKYQETLEIHMKEKHPENEMTCLYCVTNQPHPRLARGETYTCGYKPYRCDVCNYSTTTKGNLSIHMQSDKHINNVQELQNGNLTPEHMAALQQQSQQQQQQQQQVASAQGVSSATGLAVPSGVATAEVLKKAPSAPKPKATWRCDVCNYETNVARNLRIHMTSEKHTHNMMVLQQNMKHMQHLSALQQAQAMDPVFQFHPGLLMPADAQLQPEAAIADMAYNHALLMMASQQQQQQQQQHQQQQQQRAMAAAAAAAAAVGKPSHMGSSPLNLSCGPPSLDVDHPDPTLRPDIPYEDVYKMFQCCVCTLFSSNSLETLGQHVQMDRSRLREDEVLTVVAGTYLCKLCTYKTNLKANFQLHCKTDKHLQRLHHVNHVKEGGPRNEWKLKYVNVSNPVQVRCNACDYYTNSLHKLQLHATSPRHDANGRLFLHLERNESILRSEQKSYHCNLCKVTFKTKVQLIQHVNSLSHLRNENIRQLQGEGEADMREMFVVKEVKSPNENCRNIDEEREGKQNNIHEIDVPASNEDQQKDETPKGTDSSMLKQALLDKGSSENSTTTNTEGSHSCPFCNYVSNSEVRIQMHVVSQHSQKPTTLACPLCQETFQEWSLLENHLMDVHHVTQEGVQRLMAMVDQTDWIAASKANNNNNDGSSNNTNNNSSTSNKESHSATNSDPKTSTTCALTNTTEVPTTNTNASMTVVSTSATNNTDKIPSSEEIVDVKEEVADIDGKSDSSDSRERISSDEAEDFSCHVCGRIYNLVEDLFCHQNEMGHLECKTTPRGTGFFCWKKGCCQYFPTMTAAQIHFKEIHAHKSIVPVSDRHVYKYRCNQCSLAFKTMEKLQLHMQYHIIRAATKCVLCGRSFRTVLALQKHVEITHTDMTKEEMEQYQASLANNPLLSGNGGIGGGILDPQTTELLKKESNREELDDDDDGILGDDCDIVEDTIDDANESREQQVLEDYINSQAIAEDSYNDPNRKYKCHRCKVAFTRQSYLTSHNKTLLHRKGEKMSYPMEKYLDPNRPHKCDVCKESFTQKNILLVHFNSVSHLHKQKLIMKENAGANSITSTSPVTATTTTITTTATTALTANNNNGPLNCTLPSSNSTSTISTTDSEKKPFKCNICKVAYSQASTLDIHVRSVLHQTRASKLHELAMTGQIDLTCPLVEKPESNSEQQQSKITETGNAMMNSSMTNSSLPTSQPNKMPDLQALSLPATSSAPSPAVSSSPFSFPLQHDQSVLSQNMGLTPPLSQPPALVQSQMTQQSIYTCQRCGAVCMSQESLMQHQQLYCFFSQHHTNSLLSAAPTTPQAPMLPGMGQSSHSSGRTQMANHHEKEESAEKQSKVQHNTVEVSTSAAQLPHPVPQRSPTPGQQMFRSRISFLRPKTLIFRHLLEGFGFDVVMQFNENSQKKPKKEVEKKESQDTKENALVLSAQNIKTEKDFPLKNNIDLPEINRSLCNKCGKNFSSIWVLKAHQEEMHKDIVPVEVVEKFADEFRTDYEKRNSSSVPSADEMPIIIEAASPSSSGDLSTGPSSTPATPSGQTPLSLPSAITPPATSMGSQISDVSSSMTANHMAAQLQFNQLLMSMGLGMGLPMPMNMGMNVNLPFAAAMNMHPPLIPLMMPPPIDPLMASAFSHPMMPGNPMDPNFFAAQQKLLHQQQQQLAQAQQQKRARTRINDEQLKILRAYFDINNSPTEEQLIEMSEKSGLPLKVIKHWFRNTLFKERQRNKDSPYNFNNPPSTYLNLEEYEKTGEAKITPLSEKHISKDTSEICNLQKAEHATKEIDKKDEVFEINVKDVKVEDHVKEECHSSPPAQNKLLESRTPYSSSVTSGTSDMFSVSNALGCSGMVTPTSSALASVDLRTSLAETFSCGLPPYASAPSLMAMPPTSSSPPTSESPHSTGTPSGTPTPSSCSSSGKRANRTRFTDYQIKVLQEFFETNAYPKDDDLEYLSKLLNLSPRVIVVWFQNARQKARKVYENQPPVTTEEDSAGRFQRTPGLNYQCKKCLQVFQRYYELIKHQKSSCFKDENPLAAQIKMLSNDDRSQPPTPTLPPANQISPRTSSEKYGGQNGTYRCDKCSLAFPRFDLWREHQLVHMMNPTLFPNYSNSTFPILPYDNPATSSLHLNQMKRKLSDDEESSTEQPRDKRLRTTILPEQLDYLYQQYQVESNPSRKMLENIAKEVGLKKRVVQVWFQNTRARERKGQFRAHQQVIHKRCPFCRALFKARSALESHLATRHADQYTKGDINIDALPDGDLDSNPEAPSSPSDEKMPTSEPSPSPSVSCPSTSSEVISSTIKRYYEDSLRKYFDELCGNQETKETPTDLSVKTSEKTEERRESGETPLDLSKPLKAMIEKNNGNFLDRLTEDGTSRGGMDDARSETYSESTDNMDCEEGSFESNPTSPSSRYAGSSGKRFRTQMTTVQLKVMKSIFVDYKTPSMSECETLGREIGLPKRVVQVWFQNARAKEKKAKLAFMKTFGHEVEPNRPSEECTLCNVKYNLNFSASSLQEHLFSRKHIDNLKSHIDTMKKLTEGQDSDASPGNDSIINNNSSTITSSAASSLTSTPTSTQPQSSALMQMMGLPGLSGGLPNFSHSSPISQGITEKVKSDSTPNQRKDTNLNNGEIESGVSKTKDDKESKALVPQPPGSQENAVLGDFMMPSDSASLFPYMYAGFPGYYSGMPSTYLHHTMFPGRTKL